MVRKSLAYLCGEYPRATDTFIQREIAALRQRGFIIETIAVRKPAQREQGSREQEQERSRTYYLLPASPWRLVADHAGLIFRSPLRYLEALRLAIIVRSPGLRVFVYQLFYFAEAGLAAAYMRRSGMRHLHNHAPDSSGFVAMLAAKLGGFTYSITIHGFGILAEPTKWRLREKIENALFTICVSQYARSQAMLWSPRSCWPRLHVVHCGIVLGKWSTRLHQGQGRRILYVGRFDHVKGLPLLLEAFAVLAGRDPNLRLDLVGDGPERADLQNMVGDLGLQVRVTFHGYHSQAQLRDDWARADVFVLTSFMEGIPVVLMEAMANGVPVVAPCVAGIPELVEDGVSGLLFVPGDSESLIGGIERLLDDAGLRNRCCAAGREKLLKDFCLERESEKLSVLIAEKLA